MMRAIPTYIYLLSCLALSAGIASSCSSDTPDNPAPLKGSEMIFDVSGLSRAPITTSFDQFAVFGDIKPTAESNATPTTIFDNITVSRVDGKWTYDQTQYWFPDFEHSFVAIYPLTVLDDGNNPDYSNSALSFTYTLPISDEGTVNDTEVTDIVAATHRRLHTTASAVTPVFLQFSHLLAQINFSLELTEPSTRSEECFKIHNLKMSGFGISSEISIKPASRRSAAQTDDSEISIVTAKGDGSLEISFDEPIEVVNGAPSVKMFDDGNAIIMLPQTCAANENVKILLTYSVNSEEETTEVSATLNDFRWEAGKSYNYKITLECDEAKEAVMTINNASITPWTLIDDLDEVDAI